MLGKFKVLRHKDFIDNNENAVISGLPHFYGKFDGYVVIYRSEDEIVISFEIVAENKSKGVGKSLKYFGMVYLYSIDIILIKSFESEGMLYGKFIYYRSFSTYNRIFCKIIENV